MLPSLYSPRDRARQTFKQALSRGQRQRFFQQIIGKDTGLLSFEAMRGNRNMQAQHDAGIQPVAIDAIIGSVGRTHDFDADFYPISEDSRDRWVNVAAAHFRGQDLPPVELYRVEDRFYVIDGNHRVSVFKALGQHYIEAHVIDLSLDPERCQARQVYPDTHR